MKKLIAFVGFVGAASTLVAVSPEISRAIAGPDWPCPECAYDISDKKLTGTLDDTYDLQPYPFTGMSLTLKSNTSGVLDTIDDLPPTFQYGNTVLDQTVSTEVTTGVDAATLTWTDDNGNPLTQSISVVP